MKSRFFKSELIAHILGCLCRPGFDVGRQTRHVASPAPGKWFKQHDVCRTSTLRPDNAYEGHKK